MTSKSVVWHNKKYKEALYLLTKLDFPSQISRYHRKRFMIETFFSGQKPKPFLHRSNLNDPERLAHLLIASSLFSIYLLAFGSLTSYKSPFDCSDSSSRSL